MRTAAGTDEWTVNVMPDGLLVSMTADPTDPEWVVLDDPMPSMTADPPGSNAGAITSSRASCGMAATRQVPNTDSRDGGSANRRSCQSPSLTMGTTRGPRMRLGNTQVAVSTSNFATVSHGGALPVGATT